MSGGTGPIINLSITVSRHTLFRRCRFFRTGSSSHSSSFRHLVQDVHLPSLRNRWDCRRQVASGLIRVDGRSPIRETKFVADIRCVEEALKVPQNTPMASRPKILLIGLELERFGLDATILFRMFIRMVDTILSVYV